MILLWSIESELAYEQDNIPTPYLLSLLSSYDGLNEDGRKKT